MRISLTLKPITSIELERFRSVFLILRLQKEDMKQEFYAQLRQQEWWPPFVGHLFSDLLLSVCLYDHPYESACMFDSEIWSYTRHEYNVDEEQFLDLRIIFQSACNMYLKKEIIISKN